MVKLSSRTVVNHLQNKSPSQLNIYLWKVLKGSLPKWMHMEQTDGEQCQATKYIIHCKKIIPREPAKLINFLYTLPCPLLPIQLFRGSARLFCIHPLQLRKAIINIAKILALLRANQAAHYPNLAKRCSPFWSVFSFYLTQIHVVFNHSIFISVM